MKDLPPEITVPNPPARDANARTVSEAASTAAVSTAAVSTAAASAAAAQTWSDSLANAQGTGAQPKISLEGFDVLRQFEARGGEADIYLVKSATGNNVLKLYRYGINPKFEILQRMVSLSRENPRCFVQIHYFGYHPESQRFFELQEFITGGTFADLLTGDPFPEGFIREFLVRMTEILSILHQHDILHLDLKPGNVLIRSQDPLEIALTDFGIASILEEEFSKKMTEVKGTSLYQSPESLSGVVGKRSDWWSLGIMLLELLTGSHPFAQLTRQVVFFQLATKGIPIPDHVPGKWKTLLRGLLLRNPEHRWGAPEVQRWLAGEAVVLIPDESPEEIPTASEPTDQPAKPFHFLGGTYYSFPTLLEAFATSQEGWSQGKVQLLKRYVIVWLEEQRMFEQAGRVGTILEQEIDPDLALFKVVYAFHSGLPLAWQGFPVLEPHLAELLPKVLTGSYNPVEHQFLDSLLKKPVLQTYEAITGKNAWKQSPLLNLIGNLQQSALNMATLKDRVRAILLAMDPALPKHHPVDLLNLALDGDSYGQTAYSVISLLGFVDFAVKCQVFPFKQQQAWRFCAHLFDHLQGSLPYRQIFRRFGRQIVDDITSDGSLQEMVFLVMNAPEINEENVKAFQLIRNKHPWLLDMLRVRFKMPTGTDMGKFLEVNLLHFRTREKRDVLEKKVLPPFMKDILAGPGVAPRYAFLIRRLAENPQLLPDRQRYRLPDESGKLFLVDHWRDIEAGLLAVEVREQHFSTPEAFSHLLEFLAITDNLQKQEAKAGSQPDRTPAIAVFIFFTLGILLVAPQWVPPWLLFGYLFFGTGTTESPVQLIGALKRERADILAKLREEAAKPWKRFKD